MRNICIKGSFYQSSSQIRARMSGGGGFSEKYRTEMPFWHYLVNFHKKTATFQRAPSQNHYIHTETGRSGEIVSRKIPISQCTFFVTILRHFSDSARPEFSLNVFLIQFIN